MSVALRRVALMVAAMAAAGAMAEDMAAGATTLPSKSSGADRIRQGNCPDTLTLPADPLLASPGMLDSVRCLMERGHTALAVLLLQQLLAADESNGEAALLLEELLGRVAKSPAESLQAPRGESVTIAGWIAGEVGHDSNINRATSAKVIDIPLLNYRSLSLPDLLVERPSGFAGLNGGATFRVPITQTLRASLQGQASLRGNFSELPYLPHNYLVAAQLDRDVGHISVGIAASAAQQWVAKFRLLERNAARVHAATHAAAGFGLALSTEWASNTYPLFDNLGTRENTVELRASYRPYNLQFGAYWGQEASRNAIKDLDRNFDGMSIGWRYQITEFSRLAIDASSGQSRYRQFSRLFATRRSDRQTDLSVALQIRLSDGWSVTPRLMMERTRSSMALNQYRRTQYLAELRKDF